VTHFAVPALIVAAGCQNLALASDGPLPTAARMNSPRPAVQLAANSGEQLKWRPRRPSADFKEVEPTPVETPKPHVAVHPIDAKPIVSSSPTPAAIEAAPVQQAGYQARAARRSEILPVANQEADPFQDPFANEPLRPRAKPISQQIESQELPPPQTLPRYNSPTTPSSPSLGDRYSPPTTPSTPPLGDRYSAPTSPAMPATPPATDPFGVPTLPPPSTQPVPDLTPPPSQEPAPLRPAEDPLRPSDSSTTQPPPVQRFPFGEVPRQDFGAGDVKLASGCETDKKDCEKDFERLRANKINNIDLDINIVGTEGTDFPCECVLGNEVFQPRSWACTTYQWKASGLCHKPLYFEDVHLERYGHSSKPIVQDLLSGAHFFATLPLLPYKMGLETPCECIYPLGYYRPGSCAPYLLDPFPISVRAAAFEAGAVLGGIFLIP